MKARVVQHGREVPLRHALAAVLRALNAAVAAGQQRLGVRPQCEMLPLRHVGIHSRQDDALPQRATVTVPLGARQRSSSTRSLSAQQTGQRSRSSEWGPARCKCWIQSPRTWAAGTYRTCLCPVNKCRCQHVARAQRPACCKPCSVPEPWFWASQNMLHTCRFRPIFLTDGRQHAVWTRHSIAARDQGQHTRAALLAAHVRQQVPAPAHAHGARSTGQHQGFPGYQSSPAGMVSTIPAILQPCPWHNPLEHSMWHCSHSMLGCMPMRNPCIEAVSTQGYA